MVTPTLGTASFVGQSGRRYAVSVYIADVVGTAAKFNPNGTAAATNLQYWQAPENVTWVDFSVATGPTVMSALVPTKGGAVIPGALVSIADHLNTLPVRPPIGLRFAANSLIGANEA